MNKLIAINMAAVLGSIDICEMDKKDQYSILDDILLCNDVAEEGKKQGEAAVKALGVNKEKKEEIEKANKLIMEKLESENIELKKISEKAFDLILKQESLHAGEKALLYKFVRETKKTK